MALEYIRCKKLRGADCNSDHYLVVAKGRERLAVCKQAAQEVVGERFNLRNLNELEVTKRYHIEITKRFAVLRNEGNDGDINRAWEDIKESIKTSAKESLEVHDLKKYKTLFDEKYLGFLDRMKQAKIQWMQVQAKVMEKM